MVKVLQCHNFRSKRVISIQDEPLAICASGNQVFVATRRCSVVIFSLRDECREIKEKKRFDTVSLVEKLLFSSAKNCLLTLEYKTAWKNTTKFIRVYLNWDMESSPGMKMRAKVRLAGKTQPVATTTATTTGQSAHLDVVEIPVDKNVSDIGICESTGNFAIAVDREVKVFHIVEKVMPNSDGTYLDVDIFLELCWNFSVEALSLCEEFMVCASRNECQVIRLEYTEATEGAASSVLHARGKKDWGKPDTEQVQCHNFSRESSPLSSLHSNSNVSTRSEVEKYDDDKSNPVSSVISKVSEFSSVGLLRSTNPSPAQFSTSAGTEVTEITDDKFYKSWRFDGEDSETGEVILNLQGLQGRSKSLLQKGSPPVLQDMRGGPFKSSGGVKASTVLHLCDFDLKEDWQEVKLIPSYFHGTPRSSSETYSTVPVHSPNFHNLIGMSCIVSGFRGSSMYSLLPRLHKTTLYKYTTSAMKILPTHKLLHVVTKTGLETYTSRCGLTAVYNVEDFDYVTKACPPENLEICLIGMEPFIGAVQVTMTTDHVVLLTKAEDPYSEESVWSLYVLEENKPVDIYKDMLHFACQVQETGPSSYLHLVEEGHVMLKTEITLSGKTEFELDDLFLESCALLGEYYSLPATDNEDWQLCLPYYVMSGMNVDDIIRQAVQHKQHKKQGSMYSYGRGLLNYLNVVLFQDDEPLEVKEVTGNCILEIYLDTEPDQLSRVILSSRLHNYSPDRALELIKKWIDHGHNRGEKPSGTDLLALVKLDLLLCEPELAQTTLASVDEKTLVDICASHPSLIHKASVEFTSFAQLMRQHRSHSLLLVLVQLHDNSVLTLDSIIKLLQTDSKEDNYKNNQLKEFFEILVNDKKRSYIFGDILPQLSKIYVQRIIHQTRPANPSGMPNQFHLPQGSGHFAARFTWLDYLPPFSGPVSMTRICLHMPRVMASAGRRPGVVRSVPVQVATVAEKKEEKCQCCFCNEDLLKLQSLLCWPHVEVSLCAGVFELAGRHQAMVGWESMWLLCNRQLDLLHTTEFIVDRFPAILPKFAASSFGVNKKQWQHCMRCCETTLREFSSCQMNNTEETYVKAYRETLMELQEIFSPAEFLHLLPADGSLSFLLPYVTKCVRCHHIRQLKDVIVGKGQQHTSKK
ncbi:Hermansky-Pudlak syndrome 3 protein-like [Gigantopelta aegis]|uniref:Hermansky-Pudlak syndrome 3 protein-like n=1 Tax=Gigantopelta aegis TaxID=1735272 RepID=UPI001B88ACED|nr:Hermansky-Pudlak syndrome 3 protein-like [Gigantopelta aegis]